MRINFVQRFSILPIVSLLASPWIGGISPIFAQKPVPTCQPPNKGEYLLLVVSPTSENQKQLRKALPSDLKTVNCKYLNEKVTRIGGFNKIDDANRWARYVNNIVGLSAIITTRPTTSTVATAAPTVVKTTVRTNLASTKTTVTKSRIVPTTITNPTASKVNYHPQALGEGYAVIVDYFNRPEIANSIQQVVEGNVGFVSYGQRPYLLAVYTTNQKEANNTLQKLNERGFFANLVDSQKVILLRSVVNVK
jgi:hypothetical protein